MSTSVRSIKSISSRQDPLTIEMYQILLRKLAPFEVIVTFVLRIAEHLRARRLATGCKKHIEKHNSVICEDIDLKFSSHVLWTTLYQILGTVFESVENFENV